MNAVCVNPRDNVWVAVNVIESGEMAITDEGQVTVCEPIRPGHKVAVRQIERGDQILKYGQPIGTATETIEPGRWVHVHNVEVSDFSLDYASAQQTPPPPDPIRERTFQGYRRADGGAGTRNYVAIISNVNCSASVSKYVARHFGPKQLDKFPNVDGVVAFTHHAGCGMQMMGSRHRMLNRVMGGIARHPNIGAYLIIGLGCEQATIGKLLEDQHLVQLGNGSERSGPPVLSMQDQGGTVATVAAAVEIVNELLPRANDVVREPLPASELILGMECGGSDGYSGITANPAVGVTSDLIVACGGTTILGETTEIYGAEHLLTRRAQSTDVADKLIERINWWKWYAGVFDGELDNNPSVGNKEGGLTTIVEKSLGAVAKAGSSALVDVYQYADPVKAKGLVVMDTPGFDPMSVTGMVAGGANVVVFTTGRGSCFGCRPTPSIKICSNTPTFNRMSEDMDINTGAILEGRSIEDCGHEIFEKILEVASGQQTKSEIHGIGEEEFIPWTVGPQL